VKKQQKAITHTAREKDQPERKSVVRPKQKKRKDGAKVRIHFLKRIEQKKSSKHGTRVPGVAKGQGPNKDQAKASARGRAKGGGDWGGREEEMEETTNR